MSAMVLSLALPGAAAADSNGNGHGHGKNKHDEAAATTVVDSSTGNGANQDCGAYCPSGVGLPSGNGNGDGNATGKPCAGCVGNADDKNPPGQFKDGSDHNNGYECDGNNGIGKTNPAHSGCNPSPTTTEPPACSDDSEHGKSHDSECTTTTTKPPGATTTTAPPGETTTTTAPPEETTTSVSPGVTVLGEQFKRPVDPGVAPAQSAKGLAFTGSALGKLFFTGLALALLGVVLVGHRAHARVQG
jgi:hypothetical protein